MKTAWTSGLALLVAGCAQLPAETRIAGTPVPVSWIERAETGAEARGDGRSEWSQAQACAAVSRKLRDADAMESLRFLRKGAELRDGECCRQYLSLIEGGGFNFSQRLYGRLFIEHLLRQGPIRTASGADVTLDLLNQLCWAWRCAEPRSPIKARRAAEAMLDLGLTPELARSEFLREVVADAAAHPDPAATGRPRRAQEIGIRLDEESAGERSGWFQLSGESYASVSAGWAILEATAWGGGSDRLLFATGVLAFLVNERGEPSFRGRRLWIRNCGTAPVYASSSFTGHANHELAPGAEELWPVDPHFLDENRNTTGIPLTVRFRPAR